MENINSNQLILTEDFQSLELVVEKMKCLRYGEVKETNSGNFTLSDDEFQTENIYFISETSTSYYRYTVIIHINHYTLQVFETHKHKMISGAFIGDLDMFIKHFSDTEKMREFSFSTAIHQGRWNIVEYLINNYQLKADPIWLAIRWNQVKILNYLLLRDYKLSKNWLTYCIYSNSLDIAQELLIIKKIDYVPDDLRWFKQELLKGNETANFVRNTLENKHNS